MSLKQQRVARTAGKGVVAATITATRTLTIRSDKFQKITASGANRDVVLPAVGRSVALWFVIANAGSSNNVVVKNAAAATIVTLTPGMSCIVACDAATWYLVLAGALDISTLYASLTLGEGINFVLGTTTGTKIGTAVSQKLGFWNATPIVQPSGAAQAAAAAQTQDTLTDSTGGSADTTLAAVGATNSSDVSGTINNNFADLAAQLAKIKTDLANVKTLQDATRTALVNTGVMKGGA